MKTTCICIGVFIAFGLFSCSKKVHPAATDQAGVTNSTTATTGNTTVTKKTPVKQKPKEAVPNVIAVNDASAHKTVDGRYYYDLQGHRYWRNNKDGKYYLFNKTMYADAAFKPE